MTPAGVFGTHKVEGRQQVAPLAHRAEHVEKAVARHRPAAPLPPVSTGTSRVCPTHTLVSTAAMWHNNWTSTR